MAPKYVLHYFPAAGRAETARLMFKIAGVEFSDVQYPKTEWPNIKGDIKRFPLGQMPVLEVDGTVICQSGAIYRYLANELDFYGSNNTERAIVDQVNETLNDLANDVIKIKYLDTTLSEEEKTAKLVEHFKSDIAKLRFGYITELLKRNQDGNGFFVGNKVSLADINIHSTHEFVVAITPTYLDEFPELKGLVEKVGAIDAVKKHVQERKY